MPKHLKNFELWLQIMLEQSSTADSSLGIIWTVSVLLLLKKKDKKKSKFCYCICKYYLEIISALLTPFFLVAL